MRLLLFIIFCFSFQYTFAQNSWSLKGSVADHASGANLQHTTISVLRAEDSALVKFTRANEQGIFIQIRFRFPEAPNHLQVYQE